MNYKRQLLASRHRAKLKIYQYLFKMQCYCAFKIWNFASLHSSNVVPVFCNFSYAPFLVTAALPWPPHMESQ